MAEYRTVINVPHQGGVPHPWVKDVIDHNIATGEINLDDLHQEDWNENLTSGRRWTFEFRNPRDHTQIESRLTNLERVAHDPPPLDPPQDPPDEPPVEPPTGTPWDIPFASRPLSGRVDENGLTDAVIENLTIQDLPWSSGAPFDSHVAIRLRDCHNITVRNVDFRHVAQGLYLENCTNVTVEWVRYLDITGPFQRHGDHKGNLIQTANSDGIVVTDVKGREGDTEDIVSFWRSSHCGIERFHLEGTNWQSGSGSGIAVSDDFGVGNYAKTGILLNPGQVGAFIAGGTDSLIENVTAVGVARPGSNIAFYVWDIWGRGNCANHTLRNNRADWLKADGSRAAYWDAKDCGTVTLTGNDWNASLDPDALRVVL